MLPARRYQHLQRQLQFQAPEGLRRPRVCLWGGWGTIFAQHRIDEGVGARRGGDGDVGIRGLPGEQQAKAGQR
jgi:hypothetical protein